MHIGHYISGVGHAGFIAALLFGGFAPTPEPFEVTEVAVITGDEFDRMVQAARPPQTATDVAMPAPPDDAQSDAPAPAQQDTPPATATPKVTQAPEAETPPPTPPAPTPEADVSDEPPRIAPPPQEQAVLAPPVSDRPVPRPVPRVAPEPVARPEPEAKPDPVQREEVVPDDALPPIPQDPQEATAPEEATTEIVTEATEKPSSAPTASLRPKTRPNLPAAVAETKPAPATPPATNQNAVNDALAAALGGGSASSAASGGDSPPTDGNGTAPSGPPMTAGDKDALRVSVQRCWNVGSLSAEAMRTTVTVLVEMGRDSKPIHATIRRLGYEGGNETSARQAFEAARRAIIRCGNDGFDLPAEKYEHWRELELVFNPEKMRIK